jgi:uncharacterized protein (TIGR03067 family)
MHGLSSVATSGDGLAYRWECDAMMKLQSMAAATLLMAFAVQALAEDQAKPTQEQPIAARISGLDMRHSDFAKIRGTWTCTKYERRGREDLAFLQQRVVVEKSKITLHSKYDKHTITFQLDPSKNPKRFEWRQVFGFFDNTTTITFQGIYILAGDTLVICVPVASRNVTSLGISRFAYSVKHRYRSGACINLGRLSREKLREAERPNDSWSAYV